MRYFPLFHDTQSLSVLVVGGGEVAARKLALWARTQAQLTVVAPELVASIERLVAEGRVQHICSAYQPVMMAGQQGVIAATDDAALNRQLAHQAQEMQIWVNVVDDPEACSVITPALVDRSPVVVAIGSEGTAPVMVRMLRAWLETSLPSSMGQLARFIGRQRKRVQRHSSEPRAVWERFLKANGLGWRSDSEAILTSAEGSSKHSGTLYLIDPAQQPGLLPIDAMAPLQQLDRILLSVDADEQLLNLCRRDASVHWVTQADVGRVQAWLAQGERLLLVLQPRAERTWLSVLLCSAAVRFSTGQCKQLR
ncbi:bifunctional precorrin-2 dehydrogenase/sirohydrochlorin ferrochelatase [Ferrimonas pelagia]|uniref:precorrin-2 dehydrogenase n=1 Tax=Ferrimonas pelagia TaxID=1177826 RepID=A0ABP9FFH9_9GAMM